MDTVHLLGNFRTPSPPRIIGAPRQIAHYSCFPGAINEFNYQSREALKLYQPPAVPFTFNKVPDKSAFREMCNYVDSLPSQGLEPVITSCRRAGRTPELHRADVITRRGVMVGLSLGKKDVYNISFVDGKLHVLRKNFDLRTEIEHSGPYYGHYFEKLCTRSRTQKPHGTFFSVVSRDIDDLNIIMAGEVDCSTGTEPSLKNYLELKTVKCVDTWPPPPYHKIFPKWYLQSYLLGVPTLAIGYRNYYNKVTSITRKSTREILREARKHVPGFDPAVSLGRAHAIFSALLECFRSLGQSVSAQDVFELHVDANGDTWVIPPANSQNFAA